MKKSTQQGVTLIEVLIGVAIAGILMASMSGMIGTALDAERITREDNDTLQQARFALQRMTTAVTKSQRLLIPLGENPVTAWSESERDVLAVTLDPTLDRDKDGWADANNDEDYLDVNNNATRDIGEPERIDEDPSGDISNDAASGIIAMDDDGDGTADNGLDADDDDEDGLREEDPVNGIDDDNDGAIDEDSAADAQSDIAPGLNGIDDDFDGSIDEGNNGDDDEDGSFDEDWLDPVVYYLNGTMLMERMPNINPVDGTDYVEYPLADNVSQLLVKRIMGGNGATVLVDITLELTPPDGETISFNARIGVSSGL